MKKTISSIEVIKPGSKPDVDTDFHTEVREKVLAHVTEEYGEENIANIITFSRLAAKGAFKAMCTIYQVPFAQANKIVSLIPPPIEGVECTIEELYDPESNRYAEGAEFREATSGNDWSAIVEGAKKIEGRVKSSSVHACGIIMSSKPVDDVVPLQVRESDNRVITQWSYPECEELGLIKMDFLGLDTVDLIQNSVQYIMKSGKTPPNMMKLINGAMDDPATYQMLQKGETIGIFQLASPGVQDLLRRMVPKTLDEIAAATALYRPGPMGMQSHIKYAERNAGREKVEVPIDPEFKGSPLEDILGKTLGLVVFQEQILQISNQIAGMTLQEGDDLRKAMGKKKIPVMKKMMPVFFEGALKNGYSEKATQKLWDTIAEFAKYGFNRSHSYAYAINSYQCAYLKANYPVEFMAALLAQTDDKDKLLQFVKEARRMGLKVGRVDVNSSDVSVAPDYRLDSQTDIVYGLSGINGISKSAAKIIVDEREENGEFESVQDVISRCIDRSKKEGVNVGKSTFENIASAGGFDSFGHSRRSLIENMGSIIGDEKIKETRGDSLFDFGGETENLDVDLNSIPEYSFAEKLRREANAIGFYLSEHPVSRIGKNTHGVRNTTLKKLFSDNRRTSAVIAGAITDMESKRNRRGNKKVTVTIDDGTGYIQAILSPEMVKSLDKWKTQQQIKRLYLRGEFGVSSDLRESLMKNSEYTPLEEIELNRVYSFEISFMPGRDGASPLARVRSIRPVDLDYNGTMPIRIRTDSTPKGKKILQGLPQKMAKDCAGDYSIYASNGTMNPNCPEADQIFIDAAKIVEAEASDSEEAKNDQSVDNNNSQTLTGERAQKTVRKRKKSGKSSSNNSRTWPPPRSAPKEEYDLNLTLVEKSDYIEYVDTGIKADKSIACQKLVEKYIGFENYDFGFFSQDLID